MSGLGQIQEYPPLIGGFPSPSRAPLIPHGERSGQAQTEPPATISESLCRVLQLVDSCHRALDSLNEEGCGPATDMLPRLGIGEATNRLGNRVLELEQRLQALSRNLGLI